MATKFAEFLREIEAEAQAEGPEAIAQLEAFCAHFRSDRKQAESVAAPWNAGSTKPITGRLVWRDDAMAGPQFLAASPQDAKVAAALLNALEANLAAANAELDLWHRAHDAAGGEGEVSLVSDK